MVVVDLGCVDLNFGSSLAGWPLLYLHTAQAGWWNIPYQVNPTQVRDHHGHPVLQWLIADMKGPLLEDDARKTDLKEGMLPPPPPQPSPQLVAEVAAPKRKIVNKVSSCW